MSNSIKMQSVPLTPADVQKLGLKIHYEKSKNIQFAEPDGLTADTVLNLSGEGRLKLQNQLRQVMREDTNRFAAMQEVYESEKELSDAEEGVSDSNLEKMVDVTERVDKNLERLNRVKNRFDEIISGWKPENDLESIQEKQRAQADLRRMKQFEQETQQRAQKEAREAKAQNAKQQAQTDKDKGELLVMLESFEEYEKKKGEIDGAKEPGKNSGIVRETESESPKTIGDILKGSATQMLTSEMKKEEMASRSIDYIDNKGLYLLNNAREEYEQFMDEYEMISRIFAEEDISEEERTALVDAYEKKAKGDPTTRRPGGYVEVELNHKRGLAYRQNARDVRREAIAVEVMPSVQKDARDMFVTASDTVLDGQRQQYIDQASDELDRRLQEKLDDRNDVTKDPEELREEKEEEREQEQKVLDVGEDKKGILANSPEELEKLKREE